MRRAPVNRGSLFPYHGGEVAVVDEVGGVEEGGVAVFAGVGGEEIEGGDFGVGGEGFIENTSSAAGLFLDCELVGGRAAAYG